ncbi:MAG: prenyltransferase/squalene oxidase repeat-containing protein [Candidatus Taylorbacteria bacterium]
MKTKQNIFSKTISAFLVVVMVLPAFVPHAVSAAVPTPQGSVSLASLIHIPEVTIGAEVYGDISRINWDEKVIINGESVALNSDEALNVLDIPLDIKELVKQYRSDKSSIDGTFFMWPSTKTEKKGLMDDGLQFSIAKKLVEEGQLPANYFDLVAQGFVQLGNTVFDGASAKVLNPEAITPVEPDVKILDVTPVEPETKIKKVSLIEKIWNSMGRAVDNLIAFLTPKNAYADVSSVSQRSIAYLVGKQNTDGSWGTATSTKFITTVAVLDALQVNGITGTTTDNGVTWLDSYIIDNNDYLAQQLKIMARAGAGTSTIASLVNDIDQDTGGFAFDRSYEADPITTAKAIQALHASDYKDEGGEPNVTASRAITYLIGKQRFDNGWSVSPSGVSSIPATSEVIEALLLWKNRTLGATKVNDTLDPAVSSFVSTQLSNGTWGNDVLNTALAYHAIKAAGQTPTFQLKTVEYFEREQKSSGSFSDDIYITAKVAKALSIATNSGQLLITDIIPTSIIETGTTTVFKIRMTNPGNLAVDSGTLHIIADDVLTSSFDFPTNHIVVNANSSTDVTVGINNTRNYLGAVKFKVFVEGTSGVIHPGSRYEETLTYAGASDGRPALPMYFVAYKNVSGGKAAITWKWPVKSDPKLKNIVLMWRAAGTSTWSSRNITSTTTSSGATVTPDGLVNDALYEVTLGTSDSDNAGPLFFFSGSSMASIKASSVVQNYTHGTATGKVKAIDGIVPEVQILGVTASTTAQSDKDGIFLQKDIPWGTGYARVNDFRYEAYTRKFATADTNISDMNVYTNLKPDTANPTVTGVFIVGESDRVMENKKTKLIQYTVGDDIGSLGGIVKSATFYYYEPNDLTWHLIGTEQGLLTGTRTYAWTIPGNLLGTGYKIKVIVRDFAGKDSAETEWGGTFEIIAGNTAPTFVFRAPVAGVPQNADRTYVIKWTDDDPDDNASITLYYDLDNNPNNSNQVIIKKILEDDPINEYVWNTSPIANGPKFLRADIDDGHNGTVRVYSTALVTIKHQKPPPDVLEKRRPGSVVDF